MIRHGYSTVGPGVNRSELVARASSDDTCALPVGALSCGTGAVVVTMAVDPDVGDE